MRLFLISFLISFQLNSLVSVQNKIQNTVTVNLIKRIGCKNKIQTFNLKSNNSLNEFFNEELGIFSKGFIGIKVNEVEHEDIIYALYKNWTYVFEIESDGIYVTEEYKQGTLDDKLQLNPKKILNF